MPAVFSLLPRIFTGLLGDPATYTPAAGGGSAATIGAIVNTEPVIAQAFGGDVNVSSVVAYVRSADVLNVREGATLQQPPLTGPTWKIVEPIQPDGEGMTMLTLERTT